MNRTRGIPTSLQHVTSTAADILTPAVGLQGETCTTVPQRKMALIFLSGASLPSTQR